MCHAPMEALHTPWRGTEVSPQCLVASWLSERAAALRQRLPRSPHRQSCYGGCCRDPFAILMSVPLFRPIVDVRRLASDHCAALRLGCGGGAGGLSLHRYAAAGLEERRRNMQVRCRCSPARACEPNACMHAGPTALSSLWHGNRSQRCSLDREHERSQASHTSTQLVTCVCSGA